MQLEWDSDVLEQLCASVYPLSSNAELTSVLSCILASKKNLITEDIFRSCIAVKTDKIKFKKKIENTFNS